MELSELLGFTASELVDKFYQLNPGIKLKRVKKNYPTPYGSVMVTPPSQSQSTKRDLDGTESSSSELFERSLE